MTQLAERIRENSVFPVIRPFSVYVDLVKADTQTATDGSEEWAVSGPMSSEIPDDDQQTLIRAGITNSLSRFLRLGGHVDYDHLYLQTHNPKWLIGRAEAFMVKGRPWVKTILDKTNEVAQQVWDFVRNQKGRMGYSILGKGIIDGKNVLTTSIDMLTISPLAKGYDQFLIAGVPDEAEQFVAKAVHHQVMALGGSLIPSGDLLLIAKALLTGGQTEGLLRPIRVEKAFTVGAGVVQSYDTGGAAMRSQTMLDAGGKPARARTRAKRRNGKNGVFPGSLISAAWDGDDTVRLGKAVVAPLARALVKAGVSDIDSDDLAQLILLEG